MLYKGIYLSVIVKKVSDLNTRYVDITAGFYEEHPCDTAKYELSK
jgi:hypothetical protein